MTVDIALSLRPPITGDLGDALKVAGFREERSGERTPPVTHYQLVDDADGFFVEFLAPLQGSGTTKSGQPDATVATAGVVAQKLRHLEILLLHPWVVGLDGNDCRASTAPVQVQVAHPVCFLAQRLLIQKERPAAKRAQDALYIHDTLELLGHQREHLHMEWRQRIRPVLGVAVVEEVEEIARTRFASVTDMIRSACRIPQDRTLRPEEVQLRCTVGLEAIFRGS